MRRYVDAGVEVALRASVTVLMAMTTVALATAESIERGYALGTVAVARGGSPVAGVADGLLLDQAMNETCMAVRTGPSEPVAIAATPGEDVVLHLEMLGCRIAAAPRADCRWTIVPAERADAVCRESQAAPTQGSGSWKAWEGDLTLQAPARSGRYRLVLWCDLKGKQVENRQHFTVPFYVTYAEPLTVFSPPEIDWYERACCWGEGFTPDAAEGEVLRALLAGLYRYGEANWHYGYAQMIDEGRYSFPLHEAQGGQIEREYSVSDEDLRPECFKSCDLCCRCRWQGLVVTATACDFADCYVFSDVLTAMAGVMGIGGLVPIEINGRVNQGFVTHPARSLDPDFPFNVVCPDSPECPYSYYFGSHSLRSRDRLFYDATFDRTYRTAHEPIALNVDHRTPCSGIDVLTFLGDDAIMYMGPSGYGTWSFVANPGTFCAIDPAALAAVASPVTIPTTAVFTPTDREGNGYYDSLTARIEVEVRTEGTYYFHAQLYDSTRDEIVAYKPQWNSMHPTIGTVSGPPGRYPIELSFSGQQIYDSGQDGPYLLLVHAGRGEGSKVWIKSPKYESDEFGELAVEAVDLGLPEGLDRSLPLAALPIDLALKVREDGIYGIQVRLSKGDTTLLYHGWKKTLDLVSPPAVQLDVPGAPIARSRLAGPFELTLEVYGPELTVIDARTLTIEGFDASSFALPAAIREQR